MMQKGELREQRFHTGTVELNYAEGPASGEALLYLHGGDGRWQEGRALLEELASAFQVDGLDLRGHGLSGRVPGAYRLQDYVPDVATFLEQVVNRPTVVSRLSYSRMTSLDFEMPLACRLRGPNSRR
jgi:alpha-beta hydrolase superfamily lysophospholipase